MLEKLVVGWEEIEPVFLVNVALNKPFILLGKHGTCKTTCAKEIARIFGKKSYRFYDATKDDLISIAGIPIPQKLAKGKLEFSEHDRSIWNAKVIVIDELTRANKENQNLWLEILEEKTCFGRKLQYEALIATMNPESYAATFKLDEALLDRFYAVIPVPDFQKGTTSETFKKVIQMNLNDQNTSQDMLMDCIFEINRVHNQLLGNKDVINAVSNYVSSYIEILLTKTENTYISPRKTIHLVEEILGLASYFRTMNKPDYLNDAAKTALTYVLGIPFKIKPEMLSQIHSGIKKLLSCRTLEETEKIRIELTKRNDNCSLLAYLRRNIMRIEKHLPFDETEKLLSQIVQESEDKDLQVLKKMLDKVAGHEEQKRIVEGRIVFHEIDAIGKVVDELKRTQITNDQDFETFKKAKSLIKRLKQFPLDPRIERFLFSKNYDKRERIVSFLKKGGFDGNGQETGPGVQRTGTEPA